MTSLLGYLRSRDVISCHVTAPSHGLQPCWSANVHKNPVFGLLKPLPGDFQSNYVASGSLLVTWSHDAIYRHENAISCDFQPCEFSNIHKATVFGLLQPLPGDFWSNNDTSGSLPVT